MSNEEEPTKECGCSIRVIKCEHFPNGAKVMLLDFIAQLPKLRQQLPDIEWARFCIQYEALGGDNECTGGGHTDDQALAEEEFAEYADHIAMHPEDGQFAGAIVFAVDLP